MKKISLIDAPCRYFGQLVLFVGFCSALWGRFAAAQDEAPPAPPPDAASLRPAEVFEITHRSSFGTQHAQGVRLLAPQIAEAEWRILAAPDAIAFERLLEQADGQAPFDLVFPLACASVSNPAAPAPSYPGFLSDGFRPLSLPGPGMEFQIGYDGIWDAVLRRESLPAAAWRVLVNWKGKAIEAARWNSHGASLSAPDNPEAISVWNPPFDSHPLLSDSVLGGASSDGSLWIGARWVGIDPSGESLEARLGLPIRSWKSRRAQITQWASAPFSLGDDSDAFLLRLPGSLPAARSTLRSGQALEVGFPETESAGRCPGIFGGGLPILWEGEWAGPKTGASLGSVSLPYRADLAPCFDPRGAAYTWIALSHTTGAVWLGLSSGEGVRQGALPPRLLAARLLERQAGDAAALFAVSEGALSARWQGQWIASQTNRSPGNITAALCLRLGRSSAPSPVLRPPAVPRPSSERAPAARWIDALRNPEAMVQVRNATAESGRTEALRDRRVHPGGMLDSFWWAAPADPARPVILEFDLRQSVEIRWIEMLHAERAGFSAHFNLRDYTWQFRASKSDNWTDAAAMEGNILAATRHVFDPPRRARWWRLVIPPRAAGAPAPPIHRIAEIEFWAEP